MDDAFRFVRRGSREDGRPDAGRLLAAGGCCQQEEVVVTSDWHFGFAGTMLVAAHVEPREEGGANSVERELAIELDLRLD